MDPSRLIQRVGLFAQSRASGLEDAVRCGSASGNDWGKLAVAGFRWGEAAATLAASWSLNLKQAAVAGRRAASG